MNGGNGQGAPGADTRETAPARQHDTSNASQKAQMPSVVTALGQGIWHGGRDLAQTGTALGGGRPVAEAQSSAAAAPLQWSDLLSPGTVLAPKLAYQFGESSPMMAGGAVGAFLGTLAAGGPEDPFSALTGLAGGALGAGLMSGLQSFGNYFGDELSKTPGDPDGAYGRARQRAEAAGAFSGAAWAAFPARAFAGPLKNSMFQAFGVQPTVSMGHQAADNALTRKPFAELGNAYTQGALSTLPVAAGHYLGGEAGRIASQYELEVDPSALGANGGNVRIVTKAQAASGGFHSDSLPVAFNGAFATQQLLGVTATPGGRQIMYHAADRMVNPPKGRSPMSPAQIDQVLDGATKIVKRNHHPEGNTLTIENDNMLGRPRVIVDDATGKRVITVINPRANRL